MFVDPALSSSELNVHLEWPDAEALLHSIVTFDWGSLTLPPGSMPAAQLRQQTAPQPNISYDVQSVDVGQTQDPEQLSPVNGSRDAIQSLSDMITSLVCTAGVLSWTKYQIGGAKGAIVTKRHLGRKVSTRTEPSIPR
jgi:hypothetical protein